MNGKPYTLLAMLILLSMVMPGCAPAPETSAPPAETQLPVTTARPAATAGSATCAPAQAAWNPSTADKGSKGITIAFEQEPDLAVAMFSGMSFAAWIWQMFGIGPGKWDDKNNLIPYMAQEIPSLANGGVSPDGLTVTWKLKPCIFWSDGQPITSKDLAFTWKAMMDPANAPLSRTGWDKIATVDTPDDQTVVIHFMELYPAWPLLFSLGPNNSSGGILPEHVYSGKTGLEKDPEVRQPT